MTFVSVTKDEFYAVMNPMNVHPRPERDASYWETPNRTLIGKSQPGYMCVGAPAYFLVKDAV